MKLFLFVAAVSAQVEYDYGFANYGLDEFALDDGVIDDYPAADGDSLARRERPRRPGRPQFAGRPTFGAQAAPAPAAAAAPAADVNDERYFFTQTTTTTTTVTTISTITQVRSGDHCWKCDEMTYMDCAAKGSYQLCGQGEDNCCFVEVREKRTKLRQLCTGCKSTVACKNLRKENFVNTVTNVPMGSGGDETIDDQCRPDYVDQIRNMRDGSQQSVCRQCFRSCEPSQDDSKFCFGGMVEQATGAGTSALPNGIGVMLTIPFVTLSSNYDAFHGRTVDQTMAFGIPTHLILDCQTDSTACTTLETPATAAELTQTQNIYFHTVASGQAHNKVRGNNAGNNIRDLDEMTFWGLQGADRHWWVGDLKALQDHFFTKTVETCLPAGGAGCTAFATGDFDVNAVLG